MRGDGLRSDRSDGAADAQGGSSVRVRVRVSKYVHACESVYRAAQRSKQGPKIMPAGPGSAGSRHEAALCDKA